MVGLDERAVSVVTIAEAEMVFFRHLSNGQSAAAWVLCGVLLYVYAELDDRGGETEGRTGKTAKSRNVRAAVEYWASGEGMKNRARKKLAFLYGYERTGERSSRKCQSSIRSKKLEETV